MAFNICPLVVFEEEIPTKVWGGEYLVQIPNVYFPLFSQYFSPNGFLLENWNQEVKDVNQTISQTEADESSSHSTPLREQLSEQNLEQNETEIRSKLQLLSRNETKNIPKNYGKAILNFMETDQSTKILARQMDIKDTELLMRIRKMKKKIGSIQTLRKMWGSDNLDNKIKKCFRILSFNFMRKHCYHYIFSSKVKNAGVHVKYRRKIMQGIENPSKFTCIKDF